MPLSLDKRLSDFAQKHADTMAFSNSLIHSDLSIGRKRAFENIAETGSENPAIVFDAWKRSRGHRSNILAKDAELFGAARAQGSNGRWYWVVILSSKQ
jgi:uncharacterized protein YkwD